MVRFARKAGFADKKEKTTRKTEEATQWTDMFKEHVSEAAAEYVNIKPADEIDLKKLQKHEEDYNKRIELENSNTDIKKRKKKKIFKSTAEYEAILKKHTETIDKEVYDDLVEMKRKYRLNDEEFLDRVIRESRSNVRRVSRANERDNKRVCFKCRKPGQYYTAFSSNFTQFYVFNMAKLSFR